MDRAYEAYNNFGLRNLTLHFREFLFLYTFMCVCGVWCVQGTCVESENLFYSPFSPSIMCIPGRKHKLFDLMASVFIP